MPSACCSLRRFLDPVEVRSTAVPVRMPAAAAAHHMRANASRPAAKRRRPSRRAGTRRVSTTTEVSSDSVPMTAPEAHATAIAKALPCREVASTAGIVAAAASTGGKVCETDDAGQKKVLYVLVEAKQKTARSVAAEKSGTPRGTLHPLR